MVVGVKRGRRPAVAARGAKARVQHEVVEGGNAAELGRRVQEGDYLVSFSVGGKVTPCSWSTTAEVTSALEATKGAVLAAVAAEFSQHEVSIAEVRQEGMVDEGGQRCGARIVVVTHQATVSSSEACTERHRLCEYATTRREQHR